MLYFGRFFDRIVLFLRAHSSVVERYPDKIEVEGPIPSAPTNCVNVKNFALSRR